MTQPPVVTPTDSAYHAASDATSAPTPPAKVPVWEDFLDIFYAPSEVFARRERGSIWIPVLVVTLLVGVFFTLNSGMLEPMLDAEFRRSMEAARAQNPQLTDEQAQSMRGFTMMMGKVMAFAAIPVMVIVVGAVLWAAGRLVGAKQTMHAALVVTAYSYVPRALEAILTSVQGLLLDPATLDGRYRLSFGVGRFLDPDTTAPALLALVGRLDVFTIWVTVLLAIGLAVTGRIPRAQAAIAAAIVWLVGGLATIIPALRG